jgi:hypothetical protein
MFSKGADNLFPEFIRNGKHRITSKFHTTENNAHLVYLNKAGVQK